MKAPLPLCACGCGRHVKHVINRYASPACNRKIYAYKRRAIFFREELARLTGAGRRVTTEEILGAFDRVYDRGWQNGYHAAIWPKYRKREAA